MSAPKSLQVAFQGARGAYSEAAAIAYFGEDQIRSIPCPSFDDVFQGVESYRWERGIVPIENSLAGSIHRNYDLLLRHDLQIVGEQYLRIVHNLIALPDVRLDNVRRVYSHPQALDQCESWLDKSLPQAERVPTYDTAGSAKRLKEQGDDDAAAIASAQAAHVYNLPILATGIEDNAENYTRFLILGREPFAASEDAKTAIVFALKNAPGVLFKALSVFALRDIDLTKIESRPVKGQLWQYFFYMDFIGNMQEERCQNALRHLQEIATYLRVLGSFPRARQVNDEQRVEGME